VPLVFPQIVISPSLKGLWVILPESSNPGGDAHAMQYNDAHP
jgi:hypothetical protein